MQRPDQHEPTEHTTSPLAAWLPVLMAVAVMVTGCLSTFLVLRLDAFRPKIGDIIAFAPASPDADNWPMVVPATAMAPDGAPGATCSLDVDVITKKGGSMIIEGVKDQPSLHYLIHWAGQATAQAGGNCGDTANLVVSRTDLQRLANAAGGFGVGDKGIVR